MTPGYANLEGAWPARRLSFHHAAAQRCKPVLMNNSSHSPLASEPIDNRRTSPRILPPPPHRIQPIERAGQDQSMLITMWVRFSVAFEGGFVTPYVQF